MLGARRRRGRRPAVGLACDWAGAGGLRSGRAGVSWGWPVS